MPLAGNIDFHNGVQQWPWNFAHLWVLLNCMVNNGTFHNELMGGRCVFVQWFSGNEIWAAPCSQEGESVGFSPAKTPPPTPRVIPGWSSLYPLRALQDLP